MPKTKKTSADKLELKVELRKILGKRVHNLRKEGVIPANIYGPDFKSVSIQVGIKDFLHAFKVAKETKVVYVLHDSQSTPTLIKHIQKHPVSHDIVHVDFRKINLKQKIETTVPIKTIGISEAISHKGAVLLTQSDHLTIESLPEEIPQIIEIDMSPLKEVGDEITVGNLPKSEVYTYKDDPSKVIVSAIAHKEESTIAETAVQAPEVITEKISEVEAASPEPAKEEKKEKSS